MKKKLQSEKAKSNKELDPATQRLLRDYSTLQAKLDLADKMIKAVTEKKLTLMTQVAIAVGYNCYEDLQELTKRHIEIKEAYDKCKKICGLNAYEGIENRTLSGTFSKYAVTKYNKEVREERDRIKQQDHDRAKELIKARQEAEDSTLAKYITKTSIVNGQKTHEIVVDENIKMPDEE